MEPYKLLYFKISCQCTTAAGQLQESSIVTNTDFDGSPADSGTGSVLTGSGATSKSISTALLEESFST